MSNTQSASKTLLIISKRAEAYNISWAKLKILMAVDQLGKDAKNQEIKEIIGRNLNPDIIQDMKERGYMCVKSKKLPNGKPSYTYNLTESGRDFLEVVLNGKEAV